MQADLANRKTFQDHLDEFDAELARAVDAAPGPSIQSVPVEAKAVAETAPAVAEAIVLIVLGSIG